MVVTGALVQAEIGTNVFRIDENPNATGSVLDALRALPGITIGDEGRIMLRGSDRVPVLIDGKPSALTGFGNQGALDSIQASNIERIEIINNPSARFDAAGMAGIINIVYRREEALGLHGDVGFSAGVGALSRRKPDIPSELGSYDFNPRYAPTVNLTYNTETARYFLSGEYIWRRDLPNNEFHTRFYDDGRIRYSQIPENRQQTRYIFRGGVDWRRTAGRYDQRLDDLRLGAPQRLRKHPFPDRAGDEDPTVVLDGGRGHRLFQLQPVLQASVGRGGSRDHPERPVHAAVGRTRPIS